MDPDQIWTYSVDQKASKTTKADFRSLLLPVLQAGSGGLSYFRVLNEESQYGHTFRSVFRIGQLSITVESV